MFSLKYTDRNLLIDTDVIIDNAYNKFIYTYIS